MRLLSRRPRSGAVANFKVFSGAHTSVKFLLAILMVLVPLIVLMTTVLKATGGMGAGGVVTPATTATPTLSTIVVTNLGDPDSTSRNESARCTKRLTMRTILAQTPRTAIVMWPAGLTYSSHFCSEYHHFDRLPFPRDRRPSAGSERLEPHCRRGRGITIDGANLYQVFNVSSGAMLTLTNLTIQHGMSVGGSGVDHWVL